MDVKGRYPFRIQVRCFVHLVIVAGFFYLPSPLLSAETIIHTCGLPNIYGTATIPPKNQLGEFLIQLKSPEYRDRNSVREHLIFSRLWSRIIRSNLRTTTHDVCDAILDASLFPGLSAYLTIETPRNVISDRAMCLGALQDAITQPEPDASIIKKAADDEISLVQRWSESRGNFVVEADNILKQAMRSIFDYGTTMEALASVGALEFQEINNQSFEEWLRKQKLFVKIARIEFTKCNEKSETLPNQERVSEIYRFPNSSVIKPGAIKIRVARRDTDAMLQKLVLIGLKNPSFVPGVTTIVEADVLTQYCNKERTFFDNSRNGEITVTVRCLRVVELTRPWVVFFCDPKDCSTKESAEIVATAIAEDPAILALVQANTENSQPIGPYLVDVE
jgi:hypothetical protein